MEGLNMVTKGWIQGGDITMVTKGFLVGGLFAWIKAIWYEVIRLSSRISTVFRMTSGMI